MSDGLTIFGQLLSGGVIVYLLFVVGLLDERIKKLEADHAAGQAPRTTE